MGIGRIDVNLIFLQQMSKKNSDESITLGNDGNIQTTKVHQSAEDLKKVIRKAIDLLSEAKPSTLKLCGIDAKRIVEYLQNKEIQLISERNAVMDISRDPGIKPELERLNNVAQRILNPQGG